MTTIQFYKGDVMTSEAVDTEGYVPYLCQMYCQLDPDNRVLVLDEEGCVAMFSYIEHLMPAEGDPREMVDYVDTIEVREGYFVAVEAMTDYLWDEAFELNQRHNAWMERNIQMEMMGL